jgi:hypothetical protein
METPAARSYLLIKRKGKPMFDTHQKLDVSSAQLQVIEAALHTQSKILHVQAEAGGHGAHARLNEVKTLLAQLAQNKKTEKSAPQSSNLGWFSYKRSSL